LSPTIDVFQLIVRHDGGLFLLTLDSRWVYITNAFQTLLFTRTHAESIHCGSAFRAPLALHWQRPSIRTIHWLESVVSDYCQTRRHSGLEVPSKATWLLWSALFLWLGRFSDTRCVQQALGAIARLLGWRAPARMRPPRMYAPTLPPRPRAYGCLCINEVCAPFWPPS